MSAPRFCGPCSECCTWLGVEPLNKPRGERCGHLDASGGRCSIYKARPQECAAFRCAYLDGEDVERPDKLGVIVVREGPKSCLALSCAPGVFASAAWLKVRARRLSRGYVIVEVDERGQREVHGTREALEGLAAQLR